MEQHRDVPLELVVGLREDMAEVRATVAHLSSRMDDLKQDSRRQDDRLFQLMLLQLGTLATALASLVAAIVS